MNAFRALAAFAAVLVLSLNAVAGEAKPPPKTEYLFVEVSGVEEATAPAVARAVGSVEGVKSFTWTAAAKEAKVVREVGKAADDVLLAKAREAGAKTAGVVPIAAATLAFEKPLHCGGCVKSVTAALNAVKGVKDVIVPEGLATVWIAYDKRNVKEEALRTALTDAGYPAKK